MFRMYGRTVQVLHFRIDYTEDLETHTQYAVTQEEADSIAQRTGGAVSDIPASDDAWMDGLEVADVPDTYGEATRIYSMGESAYLAEKKRPSQEERITALELAQLYSMGVTPGV